MTTSANTLSVMADLLGNTLIKCYSEETLCVFNLAQYPCNSVGDQIHDLQPGAEGLATTANSLILQTCWHLIWLWQTCC